MITSNASNWFHYMNTFLFWLPKLWFSWLDDFGAMSRKNGDTYAHIVYISEICSPKRTKCFFWIFSIILSDWATASPIPGSLLDENDHVFSVEKWSSIIWTPKNVNFLSFCFLQSSLGLIVPVGMKKITAGATYGWELIKRWK